jgi:hypothetical protein
VKGTMAKRQATFSSHLAAVGVILILLVACAASVLEASLPFSHGRRMDAISFDQLRFESVKRALPAHGVIGYLSDSDPFDEGTGDYYTTEYSLAPLQVSRGSDHDLVIGNFRDLYAAAALIRQNRLAIVRDFGSGVLLLRRESQ